MKLNPCKPIQHPNARITHGFDEPRVFKGKKIIHGGLDISAKEKANCEIYNVWDGVVHTYGWSDSYGYRVWIRNTFPGKEHTFSVYGHLSSISRLVVGEIVKSGTVLGIEGSTGMSSAPHLHYGEETSSDGKGKKLIPVEVENEYKNKI